MVALEHARNPHVPAGLGFVSGDALGPAGI